VHANSGIVAASLSMTGGSVITHGMWNCLG
jgi:hypothetical protein